MNAFALQLRHAPEAAQPVWAALAAAQDQHTLFPPVPQSAPRQPVVVAVSGGADSICLLHALAQANQDPAGGLRLALHVAHLDHALRPDAADAARFVLGFSQQLGLVFHSTRLRPGQLDTAPEGLEAAARAARYAFLADVARRVGGAATPAWVAVAHHQDDQAETVLMNFLRGSGPAGLAGMAWVGSLPIPKGQSVRLLRPLLGVRRAAILAYLAAYGLTWCDDTTNEDTSYLRNRVRRQILPTLSTVNAGVVDTLVRTAALFAAEAERAAQLDRAAFTALQVAPPDATRSRVLLDLVGLVACDRATQRGVIRLALAHLGGDPRETGLAGIDRLLAAIAGPIRARGPQPLAEGIVWTVLPAAAGEPARLSLHRAGALPVSLGHPYLGTGWRPQPLPRQGVVRCNGWELVSSLLDPGELPPDWCSRERPWRAFLDAEQTQTLVLTTPRPGLQIAPLGMGGRRRSVGDLFTDHKTPLALRPGWPLVLAGDQAGDRVAWVCGLAVAQGVRLTDTTRCVRMLEWQPAQDPAAEETDGHAG